jgi:ATP-dependent Clp protease adaptor protein ClpS
MARSASSTTTAIETKIATKPPGLWDVVIFNDAKTTMEFVVLLLVNVFNLSPTKSTALAEKINDLGRSAVATFSHEIAGTKRDECVALARANGFPLKVEIEPTATGAKL